MTELFSIPGDMDHLFTERALPGTFSIDSFYNCISINWVEPDSVGLTINWDSQAFTKEEIGNLLRFIERLHKTME